MKIELRFPKINLGRFPLLMTCWLVATGLVRAQNEWTGSESGTGSDQLIQILGATSSLNFGNVLVGQSTSQYLMITNIDYEYAVTVTSVSTRMGSYSVNWSGLLADSAVKKILVTFKPANAESYSGTISISCHDWLITNVITVPVSGTGTTNTIKSISVAGDLAFGSVGVGQSARSFLTISNSGTTSLTVGGISYPTGFSGNWMGSIQPGGFETVTSTFAPPSIGSFVGNVKVTSTATSGTNTLAASGTGVKLSPPIVLITSPTPGQWVGGIITTVRGTASYTEKVAGVYYQFNGPQWYGTPTANGWTNWSAAVRLIAGTNTFKIYARGIDGVPSVTNTLSFLATNGLALRFTTAMPNSHPAAGLNFDLNVSGNAKGRIQWSTNLIDWVDWANFAGTNGSVKFTDPSAMNGVHRFYRAVVP